ncbi:Mip6p NDAI_0G05970 [Naumovozyma dairenensis CBS 421]|uniref:RRM domain-containing protein n=1 Tax=Naumovozyma dairenensis (strain ATCC 10597 / BCRC 20456 / CBS 421 / NBRC 0211 / NRRL Y-12639) TaxID=1071378 RepID=J7SBU8_NAUDC|nr:hypothetical protein NDAI_0G05970 [Naumovozyma dairenensis CBS 421]CCK73580.1 hypothetical protein NDAI_0G05970 [Naumovozyma dairenensis CBS 421]
MKYSSNTKKPKILGEISLNNKEIPYLVGKENKTCPDVLIAKPRQKTEKKLKEASIPTKLEEIAFVKKDGKLPLHNSYDTKDEKQKFATTKKLAENIKPKTTPLYIGGLSKDVTEETLFEAFEDYKTLASIKICRDSVTNESLGYGYLNFSNSVEATKLIDDYNYTNLFGNEIKIMPSMRNTLYRKNIGTNVFFSNLPLENKQLTTRKFYDTFKKYGEILSCKLDSRKNIGFVYFENDKAALQAIKDYNNKVFFGNKIICGIHFDKEIRTFPDFDKRKSYLDSQLIIEDELEAGGEFLKFKQEPKCIVPHPNAVFIKNLPMTTNDDEILDFFSKIGPVKSVFASQVLKYNSLWAFVTYKKSSDTELAIQKLDQTYFKDRAISVTKAKSKKTNFKIHDKKTVYLKNLSPICNERFIERICLQERIRVQKISVDPISPDILTNTGFVTCKTEVDANKLFNFMDKRLIGGCSVQVSWQNDNPVERLKIPEKYYKSQCWLTSPKFNPKTTKQKQDNLKRSVTSAEQMSKNEKSHKNQVLESLMGQVKRGLKFLNGKCNVGEENLRCISEYIITVFWYSDLRHLSNFLLAINTNVNYETILQKQIEQAAEQLGFKKC